MADRHLITLAALMLASACACSTSGPSHVDDSSSAAGWSAVGVPARRPGPSSSASAVVPASSSITGPRPTSRRRVLPKSVPTRPDWASGSGAPPFPQPNSVNQHSIDAVALGGARALACADTAVDSRPQHTAARAALAGWLTPTYGRAQLSVAMVVPPGARWDDWLRHRAYVVVTARLGGDDHPADTSTAAARMVALTEQAIGRDGWHDKPMSAVVAVVLKQMKGVWRIDDDQPS